MSVHNHLIKLAIPKGKLFNPVVNLLHSAGINFVHHPKKYSDFVSHNGFSYLIRILKNRDIAELVAQGKFDLGFTSLDWIKESNQTVREVIDLKTAKVNMVAAISNQSDWTKLKLKKLTCATEYPNLAHAFLKKENCLFSLMKTHGASEGFVPHEADMVIDIIDKGESLKIQKLRKIKTLFSSTLRLIANPQFYNKNKTFIKFIQNKYA